jgi:uncharacterized membrane protein YecN with MAPEG domain
MPFPITTSALAAIFAILMVLLSLIVSLRRAKLNVTNGDGNDDVLRRRIRAHGNFAENAPLALMLLLLLEFTAVSRTVVIIVAALFCASRVLHALGMLFTSGPALRGVGMVLQHTAFLWSALLLLNLVLNVLTTP